MPRAVDLPRIQRALAKLDQIAANHPELCQGEAKWADNLDMLESIVMGTPAKDRSAAYKARLRAKGYRQVSLFLTPEAHARLEKLVSSQPGRSVGEIVSDILVGR